MNTKLQKEFFALDSADDFFSDENNNIELMLLLEGIYKKYGYDFRDYAQGTLKHRVFDLFVLSKSASLLEMAHRMLRDPKFFEELVLKLSISVTEMFRDPEHFKTIREKIIPYLKTFPSIKVWVAGCSTGEEAYSIAILLTEEGLANRSIIYATDLNHGSLAKAKRGIYTLEKMEEFERNYKRSGGTQPFRNYTTEQNGLAMMNPELKSMIVFAPHNLAVDRVFTETHLILCRNVLIYFNHQLGARVFELFADSLVEYGFLGLGVRDSVTQEFLRSSFEPFDEKQKLYRKL